MGWPVAVPAEARPAVVHNTIQRYLDGERIEDIAPAYGLSPVRLYAILALEAEDEWKAAQLGTALARLEQAKTDMDSATEMQEIARARESARLAQWDLERVCRRIYGQDAPTVLGSGQVNIQINFGGSIGGSEQDILP